MRYLDDVADRDINPPNGFTPSEYIHRKINYTKIKSYLRPTARDTIEQLINWCDHLGSKFNCNFEQESVEIMKSLLFDSERYGSKEIFPHEQLQYHFHMLDIHGTVRSCLKLWGEDIGKYELLIPLAQATRIYYDLRDYEEDYDNGYINISKEEFEKYDLCKDKLRDVDHVSQWFHDKAVHGMKLLEEHKKVENEFGWLSRYTFPMVYEEPAEKFFVGVLRKKLFLST